MYKIALVFLGALLMASYAFASDDIYYTDFADPPRQFIIYGGKGITFGDLLVPTEFCPAKSDYVCFNGGGLKFAAPKRIGQKSSWVFEGETYTVKKRVHLPILGQPVKVVFIEQAVEDGVLTYIFSEERGLLGFSVDGKKRRFFLLENNCGFGASPSCLQEIGVNDFYKPENTTLGIDGKHVLPVDLGNGLISSGTATSTTKYPATQPTKGSSAPWAR